MPMNLDQLNQSIGELKGIVQTNHQQNQERFDKIEDDVGSLKSLHQRLKGAVTVISLLVGAVFHVIVESLKTKLRG